LNYVDVVVGAVIAEHVIVLQWC